MNDPDYLDIGGDRRLAYALTEGRGPTLVFLPGYMSDMEGTKAVALAAWARAEGRAMLRFDYGGCGASEGAFEAQTLADWRNDTLSIIDMLTDTPAVLVGSSMGGWLMLLVALAWPERIAGLVGIASAPDFTAWGYAPDEKMTILREGRVERPSEYAETPYVTSRAFWESGETLRLLHAEIAIDCPVRLLHGQADADVPWAYALELSKKLRSADVQTVLVKDGDHRLSRPQDIALLIATVRTLLEAL